VKHAVTILDAINDPKLFAPWFAGKKRKSFENWFTFLQVLFALGPLTPEQTAVYQQCTGRTAPPPAPVNEAWLQIGRRGGKSFVLALIAAYLACFREYRQYLAPGERGTIVIIAQDRKAARSIFDRAGPQSRAIDLPFCQRPAARRADAEAHDRARDQRHFRFEQSNLD
jgi:hypothetical protein